MEVVDRGKTINLHIPAAMDEAMLRLYAYALDPVAESTADNRSFFTRKGRSMHDGLAYLTISLTRADAPEFVFRCDDFKFFNNDPLKANGKYGRIWNRQDGRCAYCGNPMWPDQEVDVVEKGWNIKNLIYI